VAMRSFSRFWIMMLVLTLSIGAVGCNSQEEAEVKSESAANPCDWVNQDEITIVDDLQARLDAYVPTTMNPELGHLDETQTAVLNKLVAASKLMKESKQAS